MFEFSQCRLDDAEIKDVKNDGDKLVVTYIDWQEQERKLIFSSVAGYQWFSPEGKALSHGIVEDKAPFLEMACQIADEDSIEGFKIYSFVCAWNDSKILQIVAKEVDIQA